MESPTRLATRLRELRGTVTQRTLAAALRVSVPLISSWETGKVAPPVERLVDYARFFASERSLDGNGHPRLLEAGDFDREELGRFEALRGELIRLRSLGASGGGVPQTLLPAQGMWHFADRAPITIVCAALPAELRADVRYTSPESPDYIRLYTYADLDALLELYGHLVAANPDVTVNYKLAVNLTESDVVDTPASVTRNDLTNHLVLLGGVDWNPMTQYVLTTMGVPVEQGRREGEGEPDVGTFEVSVPGDGVRVLQSTLEGVGEQARLTQDIAQFCRGPNPFNRKRTVTVCNGNYGRGTLAAVRTLTDPRFRDRNREYLEARFAPGDTYSILARASIVLGEVVTPDWTQEGTILHEWSKVA
jgi:transcriptional regulator with XRE-family HTH domain